MHCVRTRSSPPTRTLRGERFWPVTGRWPKTEAFEQSRRDRKRIEMLFAHLKRILRLGRL
jgi:hypothetical protein